MNSFVEEVHACRLHIYCRIFAAELKLTILVQKLHYVSGAHRLMAPISAPSPRKSGHMAIFPTSVSLLLVLQGHKSYLIISTKLLFPKKVTFMGTGVRTGFTLGAGVVPDSSTWGIPGRQEGAWAALQRQRGCGKI